MKHWNKFFTLLILLLLAFVPLSTVYAGGQSSHLLDGRVVFGDNFTLKSGDTLSGDLVVFGGSATVEKDATVQGDLVVIGGTLTLNGTVTGSSVVVGGTAVLGATSVIKGDLVTVGGSVQRDPEAVVEGEIVSNIPAPNIQVPEVPSPPLPPSVPTPPEPGFNFNFNPLARALQTFFTAIAVAALAMLASLFLQPQVERVSQAVIGQPVIAGSIGLLTVVLSPVAIVILAITILLIPVALLVAFGIALAWLFGVISLGLEVGERFTRAVNQTWAPALTAGFGTFLLMLVVGAIGMVPCVGWLAPFLLALLGVGGVVLTMFGSRSYPRVLPPSVSIPSSGPVG